MKNNFTKILYIFIIISLLLGLVSFILQFTSKCSNFKKAEYIEIINKAKKYIREGDVFQVVPSQRFERPFSLPPFNLYRSLISLNDILKPWPAKGCNLCNKSPKAKIFL